MGWGGVGDLGVEGCGGEGQVMSEMDESVCCKVLPPLGL